MKVITIAIGLVGVWSVDWISFILNHLFDCFVFAPDVGLLDFGVDVIDIFLLFHCG